MMQNPGYEKTIFKMAEGQDNEINELFAVDATDDFEELSLLESEVDEELMEIPVKGFENVSKDEFVVVLTRISDHDCNILDEAILAGKLLKNINEKKSKCLTISKRSSNSILFFS